MDRGGSGKTTVVDLVVEHAREFCDHMNHNFTSRTIVITAMTGVAATILMGDTLHSAVCLNQRSPLTAAQVQVWKETRLLTIDEVSFASKEDFAKLHRRLRTLKQQLQKRCGGLDIVFSGDMRQLEPVGTGKNPVYKDSCPEFKDWVNCFIELEGMHRFKHDPAWGRLLSRFRNGELTPQDINTVNERVVNSDTVLPENLRHATCCNKDRDSINAAIFEEHCAQMHSLHGNTNDAVMIFCDNVKVRNSSKKCVNMTNCTQFWETCGEDDLKLPRGKGRMDPVLRLFGNCRVMLPVNTNVKEGQANGTQATFLRVVLKPGKSPTKVMLASGVPVNAVLASDVDHVVLRHCNDRIAPSEFSLEPGNRLFTANILKPEMLQTKSGQREPVKMQAWQLPVIINNATTGHKLQGSGVENLFVHSWNCVTNWPHAVLSRVKTTNGLFLREPLSKRLTKCAVPKGLTKMLDKMRQKAPTCWTEDEHSDIFR